MGFGVWVLGFGSVLVSGFMDYILECSVFSAEGFRLDFMV